MTRTTATVLLLALLTGGCGSRDVVASDPAPTEGSPSPTSPSASSPTTPAPTVTSGTEPAATVPADFPLGTGLPADDGDYEVTGPSAEVDGVGEVEVCGSVVWPAGAAEARLATGAYGPEHVDVRELLVPDSDVDVTTVVSRVRDAVGACTAAPEHQVWTLHEADTGQESVTFSLTWDDGLGASVFQLTRVGDALLLTHEYGEGTLAEVGATVEERTALTREIAPAMCAFTADGC